MTYPIFLKFVIIFALFFIGYGFTEVFLPSKLREKAIWFYPWLGTVFIAFFGTVLYYGKMSMGMGIYFIASVSVFLFFYSLFNKYRLNISLKENLLFLLIIFMISIFFSPSFNLSSLDQKANFLKKGSVVSTEGLRRSFYEDSNLIGASSLIAFFSVLSNQKVAQAAYSLQTIYLILLYPLIFNLLKNHILSKKRFLAVILSMFLLVFIYFLFSLFNLSLFHLVFFGVSLVFLTLIYHYITLISKFKSDIISPTLFEVLLAVVLSSVASIYPLGFKIVLGLLLFLGLFNIFYQKRLKEFLVLNKIIILAIIMNPIIIGVVIRMK